MAHNNRTRLNTFHLFAGAGGGILADLLLGHNPIGAAEIEKYPRDVLLARQTDGHLPQFPIWDDVATIDGNPWRGSVDLLCGGFPCQDISAAGKGAGITGERSGLWKEYARLIGEMRPKFVFAENSPLLRTRGLGVVLEDLASLGYNARWGVLGARDVGAPHKRDRMWVLAYTHGCSSQPTVERVLEKNEGEKGREWSEDITARDAARAGDDKRHESMLGLEQVTEKPSKLAYSMHPGLQGGECTIGTDSQGRQEQNRPTAECGGLFWHTDPAEVWHASVLHVQGRADRSGQGESGRASERGAQDEKNGKVEPIVGRVANGVASRVDRLKAIGNGQVPSCAAVAFNILSEGLI